MSRKKSLTLTEVELRLMQVLWTKQEATVSEVAAALDDGSAYTTVLTMLRILEQKGYLRHKKQGRAFVYKPVVDRTEACRNAVVHLLSRFFDNSPEQLVLTLLKHEKLDGRELKRLQRLIEQSE